MLEKIKYVNHLNESFDFGCNGIYINENELHNFEWVITKKNNKIRSLDKGIQKSKLPVTIICKTESDGINARNRLFEIAEKDTLAMNHGKIYVGDYYLRCFVTKSQKKDYLQNNRYMVATLTISTDYPFWIRETTNTFRKLGSGGSTGAFLDYSFDYPYDYMAETASGTLNNTAVAESNFRMIIYGSCINPVVYINGHAYSVECTVGAGEYLTIDSVTKKIYLTGVDGTITNLFGKRNRESYIFQKIPPGNNSVTWEGDYGIDIILLEERSEPKWI